MSDKRCPICDTDAETFESNLDWTQYRCPVCGTFAYDHHCPRPKDDCERALTRGWVAEQNRIGDRPHFKTDLFKRVRLIPMPSVQQRADLLLMHAVRKQKRIGEHFNRNELGLVAATFSIDQTEVAYLFDLLATSGFINRDSTFGNATITLSGHKRAAELSQKGSDSTQGFVAMWFDPSLNGAWQNGLAEGIRRAQYKPMRVDSVEHVGKIDDEIISQIRRSRFVVADFTGQRGGVYFEAGFALGLALPVIWTCRRDEIAKLHFDIRQFNCIDWETPPELAERLHKRIEAVLGLGPIGG